MTDYPPEISGNDLVYLWVRTKHSIVFGGRWTIPYFRDESTFNNNFFGAVASI